MNPMPFFVEITTNKAKRIPVNSQHIPSSSSDEYRYHRIGNYSGMGIYLTKLPLCKKTAISSTYVLNPSNMLCGQMIP